jgi:hypothetical protein
MQATYPVKVKYGKGTLFNYFICLEKTSTVAEMAKTSMLLACAW